MSKITLTKYARAEWLAGKDGKGKPTPRIYGYRPPQAREVVTCKCGAKRLLAVGQIWNCKTPNHRNARQ